MIDSRIQAIINFVPFESKVADIGADHGYLSIELVKTGRANFVIATDKNSGPIAATKKNVTAENLNEKISVRQGDGLKIIQVGEIDTVCIAGMGGSLICEILNDSPEVLKSVKKIILQPMNAIEKVSAWLEKNSWFVEDCDLAEVDGIIYEIICASKNFSAETTTMKKFSSPLYKKYLEEKILKRQRIIDAMSKSHSAVMTEKFLTLKKEIDEINFELSSTKNFAGKNF